MCSGCPTGVPGPTGPSSRRFRLYVRLWVRPRRKVQHGWFDGLAVRRWPAYAYHRALLALLGASWETSCGHLSGFDRRFPSLWPWCSECGRACNVGRPLLARRWTTRWL